MIFEFFLYNPVKYRSKRSFSTIKHLCAFIFHSGECPLGKNLMFHVQILLKDIYHYAMLYMNIIPPSSRSSILAFVFLTKIN